MARTLCLRVDDAEVLHNSNRLTLRLLPCDLIARVALEPMQRSAQFEIEVAQALAEEDGPIATPDPRVEPCVYQSEGFVVTFWRCYQPSSSEEILAVDYANALLRLHDAMRRADLHAQHFTDRVAEAQWLVSHHDRTPELTSADRELLSGALATLTGTISQRNAYEQWLHGEPHPGNLLRSNDGLVFIDWESCCLGPVEFDVAHAPNEVGDHYPDLDPDLLRMCRILVLAMITTWRWDREDQLPNGRALGIEWLGRLRGDLARYESESETSNRDPNQSLHRPDHGHPNPPSRR